MAMLFTNDGEENSTEDVQKDCDYDVEIPENFPAIDVEDSVHATCFTVTGLRIPVNFVKKSLMQHIRARIGTDDVIHGEDFSIRMKEIFFIQVLED